jgi:hypothetical protein
MLMHVLAGRKLAHEHEGGVHQRGVDEEDARRWRGLILDHARLDPCLCCGGALPPQASQLLLPFLVLAIVAGQGASTGGRALRSAEWSPSEVAASRPAGKDRQHPCFQWWETSSAPRRGACRRRESGGLSDESQRGELGGGVESWARFECLPTDVGAVSFHF